MSISEVEKNGRVDSVYTGVYIYDKEDKLLQTIEISNDDSYLMPLKYFGEGRSYTTGFNKDKEATDNEFGNIIIADLNFDGLEDLAIKREQGGNGGPLYNFYFQDKKGEFVINEFLSISMQYFPYKILKEKNMLVVSVWVGSPESIDEYYECTAPHTGNGWRKLDKQ